MKNLINKLSNKTKTLIINGFLSGVAVSCVLMVMDKL